MTHAHSAYQQQPPIMPSSGDIVTPVMEAYLAHRQKGESDFAAHHAALGVFLDHVRNQTLWAAAKAVRTIIVQASADMSRRRHQDGAKPIAA